MPKTFYYNKKIGTQMCEIEVIFEEKQQDVNDDSSDWDNRGWVDVLDVKVYDVNTGMDVTELVTQNNLLSEKDVLREIELGRDMGLREVDLYG